MRVFALKLVLLLGLVCGFIGSKTQSKDLGSGVCELYHISEASISRDVRQQMFLSKNLKLFITVLPVWIRS